MSEASSETVPDAQEWLGALATARTEIDEPAADVLTAEPAALPFVAEPEPLEPAPVYPFAGMTGYRDEPLATSASPSPAPVTTDDLAACRAELAETLERFEALLPLLTRHREAEGQLQALMARVSAGGLSVDEVIELGQQLAEARSRVAAAAVAPERVTAMIARLERGRQLLGGCIDLLR